MRTIETTAVVRPDHTLTVTIPADIPAGPCRVVVVIEPTPAVPVAGPPGPLPLGLTPVDVGSWPHGFTVSRDQIYGDDGR